MSDENLEQQLGDAENITHDIKEESRGLASDLMPDELPSKRSLRELIFFIYIKTIPEVSKQHPGELSRLFRNGEVLLRRLRGLIDSRCRFIDFEPMEPLQEAIAEELAKELGCLTMFYNSGHDSRYMVAYRPGFEPNIFEMRARRMCQKDKGQEIYPVEEEEECRLEPMFFQDGKLHWHQPMEFGDRKKAESPDEDSVSLGRKILEEFNRDYQPKRSRNMD
ncbi:uncharacterized protein [Drosophila kikkawai]|uniref:Uncharacterized protein n=1 Tax=Drosophila kikkawai TaxID=30033 RepID=A0A6P4ISC4_DROKI|nr:uncharacterized protein LOC108080989 [Drosophila kikkawai]